MFPLPYLVLSDYTIWPVPLGSYLLQDYHRKILKRLKEFNVLHPLWLRQVWSWPAEPYAIQLAAVSCHLLQKQKYCPFTTEAIMKNRLCFCRRKSYGLLIRRYYKWTQWILYAAILIRYLDSGCWKALSIWFIDSQIWKKEGIKMLHKLL